MKGGPLFIMDITVPASKLPGAPMEVYTHNGLLVDANFADLQAAVHLRNGSATVDHSVFYIFEAR